MLKVKQCWHHLLSANRFINFSISGDRAENFLLHGRDVQFLLSLENIVIACGTNNINKDSPYDVSQGLINIGSFEEPV